MKKKLWTISEVSEYLNVKKSTLYSWVRNGTVPSFKLNGLLRFDQEEVMAVVAASRVRPCNATLFGIKSNMKQDINSIIEKAIDDVTNREYNTAKRETSPSQGLRKGGLNGTL